MAHIDQVYSNIIISYHIMPSAQRASSLLSHHGPPGSVSGYEPNTHNESLTLSERQEMALDRQLSENGNGDSTDVYHRMPSQSTDWSKKPQCPEPGASLNVWKSWQRMFQSVVEI